MVVVEKTHTQYLRISCFFSQLLQIEVVSITVMLNGYGFSAGSGMYLHSSPYHRLLHGRRLLLLHISARKPGNYHLKVCFFFLCLRLRLPVDCLTRICKFTAGFLHVFTHFKRGPGYFNCGFCALQFEFLGRGRVRNTTILFQFLPFRVQYRWDLNLRYTDIYRPQSKLREGNVFTHVCDSVHRGGVSVHGRVSVRGVSALGGLCQGDAHL